jgi:phosphoglycerol transferase MdoB-like AlkP superfamily enzyme
MAQKAEIRSNFPEKVQAMFRNFWGMAIVFFAFIFLFRVIELFLIFSNHVLNFTPSDTISNGLIHDLGWAFYFLGLAFIIYLIISFLSIRIARLFVIIVLTVVLIAQLALVFYFSKTLVPLGKDLFAYSWDDLVLTVSASGQLNTLNLILGGIFFLLVAGLLYLGVRIFRFQLTTYLYLTLGFLVGMGLITYLNTKFVETANEVKYNVELNKTRYLAEQAFEQFVYGGEYYFDFYLRSSDQNLVVQKDFFDQEYPFMHKADYPDVLGPFFDSLETAPDLVFILAESIGKAYSGTEAYLGSFTPFLDSLEQHSLIWHHNVSSTGRTFGVLPGVFGGLPFGEKGFLELYQEYPYHNSLISILRDNGYKARFFIGADRAFDHQGNFLNYQQIDQLEDESTFDSKYEKTPTNTGFSWGYPDKALFQNGLDKLPSTKTGPELRIFQTQTSHDPYIVPERPVYEQKFESHLRDYLRLPSDKIAEYRTYRDIYMTVLYLDDAIRMFFDEYKKRPEYANTIFIITGDHRLPEIPMASRIDRFHVPLIIFSPLLERSAEFQGISSHFEITPTFLAFLRENAGLKTPDNMIWQGQVLDTARTFQSRLAMPLMRNKNQLLEYLSGEYFYSDGQVFLISEGLNIDPVTDPDLLTKLTGEFEEFKNKNNYMVQTRKLLKPTGNTP